MQKFAFLCCCFIALLAGITAQDQQLNTSLRDKLDYDPRINDIWGYVAPDGTEYALVGLQDAVSIVSLADPDNIVEVQRIAGTPTTWRDLKTYGNYAYVVSDNTFEGLLIVDLSTLPGQVTFEYVNMPYPPSNTGETFLRAHNIFIDTDTGYAYMAGSNLNGGGMVLYDVATVPGEATYVATAPGVYSHDVYVQDGRMYGSQIYEGTLGIYDVSDVNDITLISDPPTPYDFTHNAWTTADGNFVFTADEKADAPIAAYDISDVDNPVMLDEFRPERSVNTGTIPHNVHVLDEYLLVSYYTDGLEIADASVPENIIEVGYYDTWSGQNGGFNGNWGAYPFLPSGLVLMTDRDSGLYVVEVEYVRGARLHGNVTDFTTGDALNNVTIELQGPDEKSTTTMATGDYMTGSAFAGEFTATFSLDGYEDVVLPVTLENGVIEILDVVMGDPTSAETYTLSGLELDVFPNPTNDAFQLSYTLPNASRNSLELRVMDMSGRVISTVTVDAGRDSNQIRFGSELPAGNFFVQLLMDGQSIYSGKVVKQ